VPQSVCQCSMMDALESSMVKSCKKNRLTRVDVGIELSGDHFDDIDLSTSGTYLTVTGANSDSSRRRGMSADSGTTY